MGQQQYSSYSYRCPSSLVYFQYLLVQKAQNLFLLASHQYLRVHSASTLAYLRQSSESANWLIMVNHPFLVSSVLLFSMQINRENLAALWVWLYLYYFAACSRHRESVLKVEPPQTILLCSLLDECPRNHLILGGIESLCSSEEQDRFVGGEIGRRVNIVKVILLAFFNLAEEFLKVGLFGLEVVGEGERSHAAQQDYVAYNGCCHKSNAYVITPIKQYVIMMKQYGYVMMMLMQSGGNDIPQVIVFANVGPGADSSSLVHIGADDIKDIGRIGSRSDDVSTFSVGINSPFLIDGTVWLTDVQLHSLLTVRIIRNLESARVLHAYDRVVALPIRNEFPFLVTTIVSSPNDSLILLLRISRTIQTHVRGMQHIYLVYLVGVWNKRTLNSILISELASELSLLLTAKLTLLTKALTTKLSLLTESLMFIMSMSPSLSLSLLSPSLLSLLAPSLLSLLSPSLLQIDSWLSESLLAKSLLAESLLTKSLLTLLSESLLSLLTPSLLTLLSPALLPLLSPSLLSLLSPTHQERYLVNLCETLECSKLINEGKIVSPNSQQFYILLVLFWFFAYRSKITMLVLIHMPKLQTSVLLLSAISLNS